MAIWSSRLRCRAAFRGSNDRVGYVGGVGEEGSEEANSAELYGEAQSIVIASALGDKPVVFVIEVKEAGKLLRGRLTSVASVGAPLILGEESDRHLDCPAGDHGRQHDRGRYNRLCQSERLEPAEGDDETGGCRRPL